MSSPPEASSDGAVVEHDPRPVVRLPRAGAPGIVIAGGAALLALLLFLVIDGQRRAPAGNQRQTRAEQAGAFAPPPSLAVPPEPVQQPTSPPMAVVTTTLPTPIPPSPRPYYPPPPQSQPVIVPVAPSTLSGPTVGLPERASASREGARNSPALVIDEGAEVAATPATSTAPSSGTPAGGGAATASGDDTPVRATQIRSRSTIMATGTLIPAVLETPVDTAKPGLVRAVVSKDARGFDGTRVLIPRGSRLIGDYQSEVRSGQNRILVTWTRLLRPDGVSIRLSSPAADSLGGAGIPGRVNSFFFQRFAAAVLQSALTVGVNLAARPGRGSVIVGVPTTQAAGAIGQDLLPGNDLRPKITVREGAAFNVFVARDLDFSGVASSR